MQVDDAATIADAKDDAAFASGFPDAPAETTADLAADLPADPAAPEGATEPETPEFVQVTAKEWAEIKAAAAKTASHDQQWNKAWGTIGNLQKLVNGMQAGGPGRKVAIDKDAFAEMARDFPELAELNRTALEKALANVSGGGDGLDPDKVEAIMAAREAKREIKTLQREHPDWREVVGAVDATQAAPDPNNPFRKWLATKDATYQAELNASESAAEIGAAIRMFRAETKAPPKSAAATPRDERSARIRDAVQPRGDAQGGGAAKSEDDAFTEGFQSR